MKKHLIRVIAVVLSAVALMIFTPALNTEAKTTEWKEKYTYISVKLSQSSKWTTTKAYTYTSNTKTRCHFFKVYAYKINVPDTYGYVKIDLKKKKGEYPPAVSVVPEQTIKKKADYGYFYNRLYRFDADDWDLDEDAAEMRNKTNKTFYGVLPKGTYYIITNMPIKIRWKYIKKTDRNNYCMNNATNLKRGKNETALFLKGYAYDRWYKIKLDKNQYIKFTYRCLDERMANKIKLFTKEGYDRDTYFDDNRVNDTSSHYHSHWVTFRTRDKLPKGIYYIKICCDDYDFRQESMSCFQKFRWE